MEPEYYTQIALLEKGHWWYLGRRKILAKALDYLNIKKGCDILEVGCGSGGNLELLSQYGNIHAIEMYDDARLRSNKRNIVKVEEGALPDSIPFGEKCFDIIAVLDVLEHIDDDFASLTTIRNRLKNDGKLLLTVPAYHFLWSNIDDLNHHKRRYVMRRLECLMQRAGFSVVYSTYFNTILFPAICAVRLITGITGKEFSANTEMPSDFINSLLTGIFSLEQFFVPRISLPFGVSILVVAQVEPSVK